MCRSIQTGWFFLLAPVLWGQSAFSQVGSVSGVDAYGNAFPTAPDRRALGPAIDPDASFADSRVSRFLNQRLTQGRATVLNTLPRSVAQPRPYRSSRAIGQALDRIAFERYGGFGQRPSAQTSADLPSLLTRSRLLLRATSGNAPIRRSFWRAGSQAPSASPLSSSRLPVPGALLPVPSDGVSSRSKSISDRFSKAPIERGWQYFRSGDFRGASRAFQLAMLSNPENLELRVGELFCHASMRSQATALAALSEIERRFGNPFEPDLDMKDRYRAPAFYLELRARALQLVQNEDVGVGMMAVNAFVLWYIDEKAEARRAAWLLHERFPNTMFADWFEQMGTREPETGN